MPGRTRGKPSKPAGRTTVSRGSSAPTSMAGKARKLRKSSAGSKKGRKKSKKSKKSKKKKKKLTRAQKAAIAQKEREAQEAEEREEIKRLEKEKQEEEERQLLLRQAEDQRKAQEDKKKKEEEAEVAVWLGERKIHVRNVEAKERQGEDWLRYLECEARPNPAIESDINTYINMWANDKEVKLETVLGMVQEAEIIIEETERLLVRAIERQQVDLVKRLRQNINDLRELSIFKIDKATAYIIQHADEFTVTASDKPNTTLAGDEKGLEKQRETCQLSVNLEHIRYGLWVNVARNPRVKDVTFSDLSLSTTICPKLALHPMALRMYLVKYDVLTPTAVTDEYIAVGGVLHVELLATPPPPKTLKHWKLRPLTELADSVQKLSYPIVPPGQDPSLLQNKDWPPLKVSYVLPDEVFVRDDELPQPGWWDVEHLKWKTSGIRDVRFERSTRVFSFETSHVAPCAVLQRPYRDLPFTGWSICPIEANCARMSLGVGTLDEIVIEIREGYCRLVKPSNECFAELHSAKLSPYHLLLKLARSGVNIIPSDAAIPHFGNLVKLKDAGMEATLHAELCLVSPAFMISWSRWNAERPSKKAVCKISQLLERPKRATDELPYLTILYDHIHREAVILKADDEAEHFTEEMLEDSKLHRNLYSCLKEKCSPEAVMVCRAASDRFTESVRHLLDIVRPFSFA